MDNYRGWRGCGRQAAINEHLGRVQYSACPLTWKDCRMCGAVPHIKNTGWELHQEEVRVDGKAYAEEG